MSVAISRFRSLTLMFVKLYTTKAHKTAEKTNKAKLNDKLQTTTEANEIELEEKINSKKIVIKKQSNNIE